VKLKLLISGVLLCFIATVARANPILPAGGPPDGKIDIHFALPASNKEYAMQSGNPKPADGHLLVYLPRGFDRSHAWPILIVNSTTDGDRTSIMDAPWYRSAATSAGWIVLATDASVRPHTDNVAWRIATLSAGLDLLHRDWPGSERWPLVLAGLSGGAKRAEWIAAMLAQTHSLNIRGIFLGGINDDRMSEALKAYPPSAEFFQTPIWISSGTDDRIASPTAQQDVQGSLIHLGFKKVQLSRFRGGHQIDNSNLRDALKWFRDQGKF